MESIKVAALHRLQSETQKELSALMPSVPALSLSKGWIGRLRESCCLYELKGSLIRKLDLEI